MKKFNDELILFLKSFSLPRADKPDQPRLIIDGGTKMKKGNKSFNDMVAKDTRYTRMGSFNRLL